MRPVRLELEGFGTFRERTVVDFTDLELVAFVGPTGSGKSTVIDALTFALYGSVPRYDNPNLVAPVIHQLAVEAKVRLDFDLGGRRYRAVRVVRRAGTESTRATTREARLELDEGEGRTRVLAGNVKELDTEVQQLVGLDFTQFTRTIVLPQGEFARFIRAKASERQALLSQLLDLNLFSRMGALARERAKEAAQRADMVTDRLGRLTHATPAALADLDAELTGLAELGERSAGVLAELARLEAELVDLRRQVTTIDGVLTALAAVAVPADLAPFDQRLEQARAELAAATAERAEQWEVLASARDEVDAAGDQAQLRTWLQQHERLSELASAVAGLEAQRDAARAAHEEAVQVQEQQTAAAEAAAEALRAARTGADAAAWIAQLEPGRPCPVCAQVVTSVPDHVDDETLAAVEAEARRSAAALAQGTATVARLEGQLQALEAEAAQRTKESVTLAAALADGGADSDPHQLRLFLSRAAEAAERLRGAETRARRAEAAVAEAEARHRGLQADENAWRQAFTGQRDAVAELGPPPPTGASLAADWTTLRTWADDRTTVETTRREAVAVTGRELAAAKAVVVAELTGAARAVGLDVGPERLPVAIAERSATVRARRDQLERDRDERRELEARLETANADRTVNEALGQHLAANRFEGWLLAEALDDIVARANVRLAELSNGRYSLEAVDREFTVRDHGNADERRDIRTLSGGEIFLASLALALALASSIAELAPVDSPRLESIFLDEGFGTLDADTLDVLASAIEELSADGRLVAIVTHVRDLAERMPVRFEVRKGPTTSVIERVEA